jgi:threonine/homoserine/homoserine lactone efflux protein
VAIGQGISDVLTPAVGVAITVSAIIAVILMLFSQRARVNGPLFLLGWVVGLSAISLVIYVITDQSNASTSNTASDTISWLKIAFGVAFLLLAVRTYRNRPAPDAEPVMPKWMSGIDALTPGKAVGLGLLLSAVNPKNLVLTFGAATGLAQLGLSTSDVIVSLIVFVLIGSLTIAGPVLYYLLGGEHAKTELDQLKGWLTVHNAAVMTGVLLVLGADLIAKGLPPLTT